MVSIYTIEILLHLSCQTFDACAAGCMDMTQSIDFLIVHTEELIKTLIEELLDESIQGVIGVLQQVC